MKRSVFAAILTFVILSALVLSACGKKNVDYSDSQYLGTWKCKELSLAEETGELSEDWILTLKEDGTGESVSEGETSTFTWEPTDSGFKTKGDLKLTFTGDGNTIKTKLLGVEIIFERQ